MALSKKIEDQVLSLSLQERAWLVDRLLSSLDAAPTGEWFSDLDAEVQSRMEGARQGELAAVEGTEALGRLWGLLRQ